jgi:hypothetical protein
LHYRIARAILPQIPIRWAVVETSAMAAAAAKLSRTDLRFFASLDSALSWLGAIDLMHSNGALQYTRDPEGTLRQLCAIRAPVMFWARPALCAREKSTTVQVSRLANNGPGRLPWWFRDCEVRYEETAIAEDIFLAAHVGYRLAWRFARPHAGLLFLRD